MSNGAEIDTMTALLPCREDLAWLIKALGMLGVGDRKASYNFRFDVGYHKTGSIYFNYHLCVSWQDLFPGAFPQEYSSDSLLGLFNAAVAGEIKMREDTGHALDEVNNAIDERAGELIGVPS